MFLETQLDARLSSPRTQIRFMRELLNTFSWVELIAKEVHSREDLEKFLDAARRDPAVQAIHLVAHGDREANECALVLTSDEVVDLRDRGNRRLFADLNVETLFFSCCSLGLDRDVMGRIVRTSGADAVFSYTRAVTDYQAFVTESLFYHLSYGYVRGRRSQLAFVEVFEKLLFALDYLGIDSGAHPLADPLLAAAFRE